MQFSSVLSSLENGYKQYEPDFEMGLERDWFMDGSSRNWTV